MNGMKYFDILFLFKGLSQSTILTVTTFLMDWQREEISLDHLATSLDHLDHLAFGLICCMTKNSKLITRKVNKGKHFNFPKIRKFCCDEL